VAADCPVQKRSVNGIKDAVIKWANDEGIKAYDEETNSGTLRHIIGRQASNGDVMAGAVIRDRIDEDSLVSAVKGIDALKSTVVDINDKKTNAILGGEEHVIYGDPYITETFGGLSFRAGLSSFLQVNHEQAEKLYKTAVGFADISKTDTVFDLFCGIGTISLLAARQAKQVIGIEFVQAAVGNAKENAAVNGIENARFIAGDAGKMLDEGVKLAGDPDIVILDPPRKGCDKGLLEKIAALSPGKIVYVSCDPATLARDAGQLREGGYEVKVVRGVDMFPHTTHVETVVSLQRI
jgi:23S rRNA (uracil1939-C5)-methyltransferase